MYNTDDREITEQTHVGQQQVLNIANAVSIYVISYNQRLKTKQQREITAYVQVLNIIIKCSNSN